MQPTFETLTFSDGYAASARWWLPDAPRGAVLYFHGIESHGGWYEGSGSFLAEHGYVVLMPDRRGSGRNTQARGHADSPQRLLADGAELIAALQRRVGATRVHLVGVSWGGKFAVALAVADPRPVASLSLIAPGLFPRIDMSMADKLRIGAALLGHRTRPFPLPIHDAGMFTANPERRAFVESDPLRLREATASFLLASRRLDRTAARLPISAWSGGLHLVLAGRDRIIDNEPTRQFVRRMPTPCRRISEFPEASHTIEFEPDPLPFWQRLVEELDAFRQAEAR